MSGLLTTEHGEIPLAGGPGHGAYVIGEYLHAYWLKGQEDVDLLNYPAEQVRTVQYTRQTFILEDGQHIDAFVLDGKSEVDAAYHIGRLMGEKEARNRMRAKQHSPPTPAEKETR